MQIKIDTEILETIFTHATTAARLAGYLDDPIAVDGTIVIDEVVKSLEKIGRLVAERLGKPYGPRGVSHGIMPHFGDMLAPEQIKAVVDFERSL